MNEIKAEIIFTIDGTTRFAGPDQIRALMMYESKIESARQSGRSEVLSNIFAAIKKMAE